MDLGDLLNLLVTTGNPFNSLLLGLWTVGLKVLQLAFGFMDQISVIDVSLTSGPISKVWPLTLGLSAAVAVAMFFLQLTSTVLKGGEGFVRLLTGPVQYGIALAVSVGGVAALLASADLLSRELLSYGLRVSTFTGALGALGITSPTANDVAPLLLAVVAVVGVIPSAIAYLLEMLFRTMSIDVLVAVLPIAAAGLVAVPSARWFWRTLRWVLAAVLLKPGLALVLVIGIGVIAGSSGFMGVLAGSAVLLLAVLLPFVLYRLLAFVDPGTDAGKDFRSTAAQFGFSGYGANNPAVRGVRAGFDRWRNRNEDDTDARFDDAAADDDYDDSDDDGSAGASPADGGRPAGGTSSDSSSSLTTGPGGAGRGETTGGAPDADRGGGDHAPATPAPPGPVPPPGGDADGSGAGKSSMVEEAGPEAAL